MYLKDNVSTDAHLGVPVADIIKARKWYKDILGFKVIDETQVGDGENAVKIIMASCGNITLELFEFSGAGKQEIKARQHGIIDSFALKCTNLAGFKSFLREKNIPVLFSGVIGKEKFPYIEVEGTNGEKIKIVEANQSDICEVSDWYCLCQRAGELQKSKDFYRKFGFEVTGEYTEYNKPVMDISREGFTIHMTEDKLRAAKRNRGKIDHLALKVENDQTAYDELKKTGEFHFLNPEPVFQPNVFGKGAYYFFIEGPDGEGLEFTTVINK